MIVSILIGPPGSGKTYKRKELLQKQKKWAVVSRDELRKNFNSSLFERTEFENLISQLEETIVKKYIKSGISFIWDNMNIKLKYLKKSVSLIKSINNEVSINLIIMQTDLKTCLENNLKRKGTDEFVPENVIKEKYNIFKNNYDLYPSVLQEDNEFEFVKYTENPELPEAIIVDIDGTLAHADSRGIFDFSKVHYDKADKAVKDLVNRENCKIIIVTGRENIEFPEPIENCRNVKELTELWLKDSEIKYDFLFLRKQNDSRKDTVIKNEIFQEFINGKFSIKYCLDDRDSVVKFWRSLGLKCFQVAKGDF